MTFLHHTSLLTEQLRDFSANRRLPLLSALAVVAGTGGALSAWVLQHLIYIVTNIAYFGKFSTAHILISSQPLGWSSVLVPIVGCLLVGLMARYGSEKIRGHGIPEALEAILIGKSRISPKVAFLKPLSSAFSIGTGGPFGAEGPIIMTGGALGSIFAQMFDISSAERKTLLVAGAAAGMAATFNTPIASMLLAVELLLFEWKPRSFIPVAIACAVAAAWRPLLLGTGALFPMATTVIHDLPLILAVCAILGVFSGLMSGLLTQMVYGCEDFFQRLPIHWMWWPALGGVVIGLGGMIDSRALGVGYDNIAALLAGHLTGWSAVRLLTVKSVIWAVALGSGTSGGVLAPLLMMGGAAGAVCALILPFGHAGFWALICMAAVMGGTMRAPLTATIFAFELTGNGPALLPLAVACVAAQGTTVMLLKRSILTEKVARRGYHIFREYIVDPYETTSVAEIMKAPVEHLPASMQVADAVAFFRATNKDARHETYPVLDDDNKLAGMVSRADALRWIIDGWPENATLASFAVNTVVPGYSDEMAAQAADQMISQNVDCLPLLNRKDGTLAGIVTRSDLLRIRHSQTRQESETEVFFKLKRRHPHLPAHDTPS